jgi:hypothetical protein
MVPFIIKILYHYIAGGVGRYFWVVYATLNLSSNSKSIDDNGAEISLKPWTTNYELGLVDISEYFIFPPSIRGLLVS